MIMVIFALDHKIEIKEVNSMNKTDLHTSLLFLMFKLEEVKSDQMADKNFVAALTEVLRYFRDNGELKKAYDLLRIHWQI